MKKFIVLAISCFVYGNTVTQAQENLNKEVIDVVKDFRPKVMQANKIKAQPIFIDTSKVSENLSYHIRFEEFRVQQEIDSIEALLSSRPTSTQLYTKHAELGLGTLLNPHLAFDLSNGKNTNSMYQAQLNYNGAYSNRLDVEDQFSNLNLAGVYKRIFNGYTLQSGLKIKDINRYNNLGSRSSNRIMAFNSILQLSDSAKVFVPSKVHVDANLFYRNSEFVEHKFAFSSKHNGVHPKLQDWALTNSALIQKSHQYSYFHWKTKMKSHKKINLLEIQTALQLDVLSGDVKLIPELRAQYQLIEKGLYAYTEIGGDRNLYSWASIFNQNYTLENRSLPRLYDLPLPDGTIPGLEYPLEYNYGAHSNTKYYARVGLNGNLFRGVSYQMSLEANTQDQFLHFVHLEKEYANEIGLEQWVGAMYTELKSVQLHAELDAKWTDKFHVWLKGDYRTFDKHLSYVPELELGLYTAYHYNDQWFLNSSFRYLGNREALTFTEGLFIYEEKAEKLKDVLDFNLKLNFAYNNQLGFYLEGLNLFNQDYILWQENPVLGRQINLGAKYRF